MENLLIMTVGLPRSGKSTQAALYAPTTPVVCPDAIRLALHGSVFIAEAEPFVWAIAKTMVRALFMAGNKTVVLDATNITKARRDEWKSPLYRRQFDVIDTSAEVCKQRAIDGGRDYLLPIIDRMAAEYEAVTVGEIE